MRRRTALGDLPKDTKPTLAQLREYPEMTGWFSPVLLLKLLWRVIVYDLFGQYADRRLIEAALDPVSEDDIRKRDDLSKVLPKDESGAVWVDFVADLGDGFDATYAVAYLLGQPSLTVVRRCFRGAVLYLWEGMKFIRRRAATITMRKCVRPINLRSQIKGALANIHPFLQSRGITIGMMALVNFLAFFARQKATRIGNWRTQQRRSYYAAKLTDQCWIWAIDIALVADIDQPQADYFVAVAKEMPQNASVILCSAEPGWYKVDSDSYRTLSYAAWIAENAGKSLRISLVLSGDTHHYARYSSDHGTHYVTSGGGGAFLHGTHQLPDEITADWLRYSKDKLSLQIVIQAKIRVANC